MIQLRRPRLGLLSLSVIADDLRVRRQGDFFAGDGWDVAAFGFGGGASPPPAWTVIDIEQYAVGRAEPLGAGMSDSPTLRRLGLLGCSIASRLFPGIAERAYWRMSTNFEAMLAAGRDYRPDVWIANDWITLPIVRKLAAEQGVPYTYDTHELATEEYAQSWRWRVVRRPLIKAIEMQGVAQASAVSCVSRGIAQRLVQLYGLGREPIVLRNIPNVAAQGARPAGDRIRVLYHGAVAPGRGLEACIESVPFWRPEFDLTIRGPATDEYRARLEQWIAGSGAADRITLAPAVTATQLVEAAASSDIGLFALPAHSLQNIYALPNKLFEYVAAGLALCVSDLPEMADFVREHDLGVSFSEITPRSIADAVNSFDFASLVMFKARARDAAQKLNAHAESAELRAELAHLVGRRIQSSPA